MRYVIIGAGAVGGLIGGRLHQYGSDVALVARGAQYEALRTRGLRLDDPDDTVTLDVPVHAHVSDVDWRADDVAILAMKSQDTVPALDDLVVSAPPDLPIVCAQNGVENERQALRRFPFVYAMHVMCPATYLEPGVVQARSAPISGLLDIGRYPQGVDTVVEQVTAELSGASFDSRPMTDIMRWKYAKLLLNLANAVQIVFPHDDLDRAGAEIATRARDEGVACLEAAGIPFASREEDEARRGDLLSVRPVGDQPRTGSSTWQSVARGAGSVETDYLNGEIVLLGRLHRVPTPVNALLQRLAADVAAGRLPAGGISQDEFFERLTANTDSQRPPSNVR
ncbi:ketopantoate reductase family protein [Actinobacteria bacterium YIM 96077]|uniref:Ketopantoate reductase family protein n=1 Tax=Phytoactinopolyspora halophila TaxID=1981511 RepID=A0A329QEV6_9ACTN|nr:2-dehydropantoate 2-reductase N-terminal domain-containing protein [Phytoactinopolyspora halophila]AYY13453.1 ketopantoate reductase family protein [Actinobacteria bacterium YIM 96077]RAW10846.1 ketopantoate reductase family protein [Phytoactinopolyspora halophila]